MRPNIFIYFFYVFNCEFSADARFGGLFGAKSAAKAGHAISETGESSAGAEHIVGGDPLKFKRLGPLPPESASDLSGDGSLIGLVGGKPKAAPKLPSRPLSLMAKKVSQGAVKIGDQIIEKMMPQVYERLGEVRRLPEAKLDPIMFQKTFKNLQTVEEQVGELRQVFTHLNDPNIVLSEKNIKKWEAVFLNIMDFKSTNIQNLKLELEMQIQVFDAQANARKVLMMRAKDLPRIGEQAKTPRQPNIFSELQETLWKRLELNQADIDEQVRTINPLEYVLLPSKQTIKSIIGDNLQVFKNDELLAPHVEALTSQSTSITAFVAVWRQVRGMTLIKRPIVYTTRQQAAAVSLLSYAFNMIMESAPKTPLAREVFGEARQITNPNSLRDLLIAPFIRRLEADMETYVPGSAETFRGRIPKT
ncbi:hypothetical protein O181_041760 [Austropuccinia psidii MF-1]|uniref:Uncharacterized protein n=1 Tax=Austropuccinia psidii MF-1 TaxID=1389203 RepID=A0A9Q3HHG4_9BASI|nr:hypothetical protein [Austropuccinia psidii MF-1]